MAEDPMAQAYAPPRAEVADLAPADGSPVLAGRGQRLLAMLIDAAVLVAVSWLVLRLMGVDMFDTAAADSAARGLRDMVIGIVVLVAVQGVLLVQRGQTVGKLAMGLRIVRPDGRRADALRVLGLRYVLPYLLTPFTTLLMLWSLADALAIFGRARRCLHDRIADTIVVRA